jgi:phosphoribosylglycinamide formyltransferase-1
LLKTYQNKVINLHPSLLPKYGGKGMYGTNVHKAVVSNKETESGITIHYVNEYYDQGAIIFQAKCPISQSDTFNDVAYKIRHLELDHFPTVIHKILCKNG